MTCGPRTKISPSPAILTSVAGTVFPTVPIRDASNEFKLVTGLVSVRPYPSKIGMPMELKNRFKTGANGPPPLTK